MQTWTQTHTRPRTFSFHSVSGCFSFPCVCFLSCSLLPLFLPPCPAAPCFWQEKTSPQVQPASFGVFMELFKLVQWKRSHGTELCRDRTRLPFPAREKPFCLGLLQKPDQKPHLCVRSSCVFVNFCDQISSVTKETINFLDSWIFLNSTSLKDLEGAYCTVSPTTDKQ